MRLNHLAKQQELREQHHSGFGGKGATTSPKNYLCFMILKTLFNAIIQRNDFDKYRALCKLIFQGLSASEYLPVSGAVI